MFSFPSLVCSSGQAGWKGKRELRTSEYRFMLTRLTIRRTVHAHNHTEAGSCMQQSCRKGGPKLKTVQRQFHVYLQWNTVSHYNHIKAVSCWKSYNGNLCPLHPCRCVCDMLQTNGSASAPVTRHSVGTASVQSPFCKRSTWVANQSLKRQSTVHSHSPHFRLLNDRKPEEACDRVFTGIMNWCCTDCVLWRLKWFGFYLCCKSYVVRCWWMFSALKRQKRAHFQWQEPKSKDTKKVHIELKTCRSASSKNKTKKQQEYVNSCSFSIFRNVVEQRNVKLVVQ